MSENKLSGDKIKTIDYLGYRLNMNILEEDSVTCCFFVLRCSFGFWVFVKRKNNG